MQRIIPIVGRAEEVMRIARRSMGFYEWIARDNILPQLDTMTRNRLITQLERHHAMLGSFLKFSNKPSKYLDKED